MYSIIMNYCNAVFVIIKLVVLSNYHLRNRIINIRIVNNIDIIQDMLRILRNKLLIQCRKHKTM